MGAEDLPIRDPAARELAERDLSAFDVAEPPGFRLERAQLRLQAALDNGVSRREAERLGQLARPPVRGDWHLAPLRRAWASARRWRVGVALGAGLATALAAAVLWMNVDGAPPQESSEWLAAADQTQRHQLEDGSSIVLSPGAQGRLLRRGAAVHFDLDRGHALFDVVPAKERDWRVTARNYQVRVVGTRFSVLYDAASGFEVEVSRGAVSVQVPEQASELQLVAGDFLSATDGAVTLRHEAQAALGEPQLPVGDLEQAVGHRAPEASRVNDASASTGSVAAAPGSGETADADGATVSTSRSARAGASGSSVHGVGELQLLSRARKAIAAGEHAAAMKWIRAHQQRFPAGQLIEEREALRIKALRGMGREEEARSAAGEFKQRFPKSVLSPQMPTDEP